MILIENLRIRKKIKIAAETNVIIFKSIALHLNSQDLNNFQMNYNYEDQKLDFDRHRDFLEPVQGEYVIDTILDVEDAKGNIDVLFHSDKRLHQNHQLTADLVP